MVGTSLVVPLLDSALTLQGAWVQPLVTELTRSVAKRKKKERERENIMVPEPAEE